MENKNSKKPTTKKPSTGKNLTQKIKEKIVGKKSVSKVKANDSSLEIKFKNVTFEVIGADKIMSLAEIVGKGSDKKIIVTIPEYIFTDLEGMAQKYLKSHGLDLFSYLHSDFLKNILLPYKGVKGRIGKKDFMIWKENKLIIIAVDTK